jgi:hypothetical protein
VARNTSVLANFSEAMKASTINNDTFKLYRCSSTKSTSCTTQVTNAPVSLSADGLRATLDPYGTSSTLLLSKSKYKAVITTGAEDVAGNPLDQDPAAVGKQEKACSKQGTNLESRKSRSVTAPALLTYPPGASSLLDQPLSGCNWPHGVLKSVVDFRAVPLC